MQKISFPAIFDVLFNALPDHWAVCLRINIATGKVQKVLEKKTVFKILIDER